MSEEGEAGNLSDPMDLGHDIQFPFDFPFDDALAQYTSPAPFSDDLGAYDDWNPAPVEEGTFVLFAFFS